MYFGTLKVGTVLDAAAGAEFRSAVAMLADHALGDEGADLVITNQSLPPWQEAFRQAGFRRRPSNYVFAGSLALVKARSPTDWCNWFAEMAMDDCTFESEMRAGLVASSCLACPPGCCPPGRGALSPCRGANGDAAWRPGS